MTDWVPVFGERVPNAVYVPRPSAYVVIRDDDGRFAIVRAPNGVFLPGGGIDPGETPEEAAVREALEECGFEIELVSIIARVTQRVTRRKEPHREQATTFFAAVITGHRPEAQEPGHEVLWLSAAEATPLLTHESHAWVIEMCRGCGTGS